MPAELLVERIAQPKARAPPASRGRTPAASACPPRSARPVHIVAHARASAQSGIALLRRPRPSPPPPSRAKEGPRSPPSPAPAEAARRRKPAPAPPPRLCRMDEAVADRLGQRPEERLRPGPLPARPPAARSMNRHWLRLSGPQHEARGNTAAARRDSRAAPSSPCSRARSRRMIVGGGPVIILELQHIESRARAQPVGHWPASPPARAHRARSAG